VVDSAQLRLRIGSSLSPPYPFALSDAEIATFLSHRACWQAIVDSGQAYGLIVEDDVALNDDFTASLQFAESQVQPEGFIRFPQKARERVQVEVARHNTCVLFRPRVVGLGMLAQLVTQGAARRLLSITERFDRPVDVFLQMTWVHGVDVLSVWPTGVTEISAELGGSTIHRSRAWPDRLWRELARPTYRLAVALRSRLG
jgi:GR25 family glycosyltransferase involved in LPS biosynthesis